MRFNYQLADEIINAIFPLPSEFGLVIHSEDHETDVPINYDFLQNLLYDVDSEAEIRFGITKLVIISPNLGNIVIKIPFNGYYSEDPDNGDLDWEPFYWAPASDRSDYCLAEFEKYKELKKRHLDCFVAKTILYKTIDNVRVFIQEFATPEEDDYDDHLPSYRSRDLAKKWYKEGRFHMDSEWIANCIDKYGANKVERFLFYCENIDFDILEDVHLGNYGYRNNSTPCILDYSNYLE